MQARKCVLACLLAIGSVLCAQQTDSTIHVNQFAGATVAAKVTAAMATCPNSAVPCILVIDPSLATVTAGTMPTLCGNCYLSDWRTGPPSGGGGMTWPSAGGIPVYAGGNAWGASYSTACNGAGSALGFTGTAIDCNYIGSPFGLPLSIPTVSSLGFSTSYGVTGTYSQSNTAIGVNFADTANIGANVEGSLMAYPGVPFTYTVIMSIMPSSDLSVCLGPAASATGATEIVVQHASGGTPAPGTTDVEDWNTPTSFNQTVANTQRNFVGGGHVWFRYKDTGTTLLYQTSTEGVNWDTVYTVAKASDFLSTNGGFHYFGVIISTYNGAGGTVMLGQQMTTP